MPMKLFHFEMVYTVSFRCVSLYQKIQQVERMEAEWRVAPALTEHLNCLNQKEVPFCSLLMGVWLTPLTVQSRNGLL